MKETAEFTRNEYADSIRKSPYQVSSLLAGFDEFKGAQLYWMDYYGTLQEVQYGSHGYAAYLVQSILSDSYQNDLTVEQAVAIAKDCVSQLRTRFMIAQDNFLFKIIDKDGIRILN